MKLLFLSVTAGQGHHQVALALEKYFENIEGTECRTIDVFDNVNPILCESLERAYLLSTKVTPKVYGKFYELADRRDANKDSSLGKVIKSVVNHDLMRSIRDYKPDAIICTHNFAAIALSYLKRKYPIKAKTFAVVTDFTVHPFWEDTDLDYYITASELLNFQMHQKGIPEYKIKPFGIPIMSHFAMSKTKEQACKELGIENKFTVLMMMGSMGYGTNTFDILKELDVMREDFQILVVCGKNKKLKRRIDDYAFLKNVVSFSFTDKVSLLMDASDCIITKPGGLSTSESLAKGLPMIMLDPIPGQEDRNKEFLLNNGISLAVSDSFTISEAIYTLTKFPYKMELLKENMKHLSKPNSTSDFAEFVMEVCKK
ncbi:MAG: galactosyldiacylglycerol synthase [Clostridia bacterium]|nr:galactosyldiacylglycerol synthase [Clostridia bacterium]